MRRFSIVSRWSNLLLEYHGLKVQKERQRVLHGQKKNYAKKG